MKTRKQARYAARLRHVRHAWAARPCTAALAAMKAAVVYTTCYWGVSYMRPTHATSARWAQRCVNERSEAEGGEDDVRLSQ